MFERSPWSISGDGKQWQFGIHTLYRSCKNESTNQVMLQKFSHRKRTAIIYPANAPKSVDTMQFLYVITVFLNLRSYLLYWKTSERVSAGHRRNTFGSQLAVRPFSIGWLHNYFVNAKQTHRRCKPVHVKCVVLLELLIQKFDAMCTLQTGITDETSVFLRLSNVFHRLVPKLPSHTPHETRSSVNFNPISSTS